jgi:RNA-binding protein YlmH
MIDKPVSQITKRKMEKMQINKIRDEKGDITTNTNVIQSIIREYFENLYSNKLEKLNKMNKFLDVCDLSNLNQETIKHVSRSIINNDIEAITKSPSTKKSPGPDSLPNVTDL